MLYRYELGGSYAKATCLSSVGSSPCQCCFNVIDCIRHEDFAESPRFRPRDNNYVRRAIQRQTSSASKPCGTVIEVSFPPNLGHSDNEQEGFQL